jgi:hypothetical protein
MMMITEMMTSMIVMMRTYDDEGLRKEDGKMGKHDV